MGLQLRGRGLEGRGLGPSDMQEPIETIINYSNADKLIAEEGRRYGSRRLLRVNTEGAWGIGLEGINEIHFKRQIIQNHFAEMICLLYYRQFPLYISFYLPNLTPVLPISNIPSPNIPPQFMQHFLYNSKFRMSLGSVSDIVEYFNLNRHIFEKQKSNKQHMQRIMSMLSQENMQILEKEFELYPKGLELPTFIYLMKKLYSPENQISKYYFVSDLIKFFQAIDINGDGHLEWSEFTEYIIENIRRVERPNYKNKVFQENEVISSAYSKISNEYKITNVVDTGTNNCIKKIVYIAREQRYYLLEAASNLLRIYDAHFTLQDYLELQGESPHSHILDFAFDKVNMVFCAIFEASARYCNLKLLGNVKSCNECEVKKLANYHKVQYLPLHKYWAFLSKTGEMKLCTANYRSRTNLDFSVVSIIKQHESLITEVCEVEEPLYILTSSMDGNVKFYSTYLKKSVNLEHIAQQTTSAINSRYKKGVLGVDYTREFGSYVLTYGFCSSIYVYSLDISLVKGFTGKYKEHGGNLITARFLKSFPYVLSFDDKLNMRIWDFRRFQTIQIINCEKNFINPSRLEIIPELSECLVCEKKVTQFRAPSLEKKSREINEFHVIFDFRICSMSNSIFLFTSNDVRVYNYNTGCLEKVFTKLNEAHFETNITACEFGYKSRKFFLGDAGGFVREYCSETGDFLQHIAPDDDNRYENKAVVRIIFLKEHSLLIVCTLDGRILIYERDSESEFQLIRDMRQTHFELTCAEASARYCTLATCSEDGVVNIWNLEKLTLEGVLVLKGKILHLAFSPIHPIMVVVEESGIINFFYIRPFDDIARRNHCFAKLHYSDLGGIPKKISSVGLELVINAYIRRGSALVGESTDEQHLIAAIGGEDGRVLLVNLTELLVKFKIEQNHQIFTIKQSIKCQVHSLKTTIANEKKKVLMQGFSSDGAPSFPLQQFSRSIGWEAHKEKVERVLLVKENAIILSTSSGDKRVKVWSLGGELQGAIDFFTFKKTTWRVAEMNFHKKLQAIDTTIYSMKLIENKKLTSQEQEFIRVNLLINEYMNAHEKEDYMRWVSILKRTRANPRRKNRSPLYSLQEEDQTDVRDEIEKFDSVNHREGREEEDEFSSVEFNQIYNKLVAKIKNKLEKSELPTISKKDIREEMKERESIAKEVTVSDFIISLRKTLRCHQEEEKKFEKDFSIAMNKKTKTHKKSTNMLYQSLVEVRKNIEAMEKKTHLKPKRL